MAPVSSTAVLVRQRPVNTAWCCTFIVVSGPEAQSDAGATFRAALPLVGASRSSGRRAVGLVTAVVVGWARAVGGCGEPAGEELRHLEKNGEKVAQTLRREQHGHSAGPSVPLQRG